MIFKIYLIVLTVTISQVIANDSDHVNHSGIETFVPNTTKEQRVTFTNSQDIRLEHFENAKIITSNGSIFLLNGIDLFAVNVTKDSEGNNIKNMGSLQGVDNQTISKIKASFWRDYIIFIAALDKHYNVYVAKNNESTDFLEPIEKLKKQGSRCKIEFFQFNGKLYCVIVNLMPNQESSTIYIYKWRKSHFTRLEKFVSLTVDDLFVFNTGTFPIIVAVDYSEKGIIHNTALSMYTLDEDKQLKHVQMSYLDAASIFPVTLHGSFYFYSTSPSGLITSYQWDTDKFVKLSDYKDLKNVKLVSFGEDLIIGQTNDQLVAYTDAKLSTASEISNLERNFSEVLVTKSNERVHVTFFYKSSNDLMLTTLETKREDVHEEIVGDARDVAGDCVTNIRNIQRELVPVVEIIKNMIPLVYNKEQNLQVDSKLHVKTLSVAKKVNIRRLNIDANLRASISQIKNGIDTITARLNTLRNNGARRKREVGKSVHTVNVKRLNIPKKLFENLLVKTNGSATFKGKLTTKTLKANSVKFGGIRGPNVGTILPSEHKKVDGLTQIRNLEVKTINGIDWNDFRSSLYLKDSPQPIEGNLILSKFSKIRHLDVNLVNEYPVNTLFTLNTNQDISSNIFLQTFHSPSIDANLINGIDFGSSVAKLNENNIIETPVKILQAHIGDLTLANSEDDEFITKHIVGTRVEDLSQVYNGKVVIKGSLRLSNVLIDSSNTNIFVNDKRFRLNVAESFWMKSVDQTIGNVKWTSLITAPQLFTTSINNIPTENFVIVNVAPKMPVNLIFQKLIVHGNVYTDTDFETILTQINKECVRRGSSTVITGTKTFTGLLSINDFTGDFVDYPTTDKFVVNNNADNKFVLDCTKKFESVTLDGNVEFGSSIILNHLNGVNLMEFFQNSVKINQPTRLASLAFANIKATNLTVNQINKHSFMELVSGLENSVGREGNLNSIYIHGDLNISRNLMVNTINEINFDDYLGLIVTSGSGGQIGGVKRFLGGLSVVNLNVRRINSVDFGYWFENALHKHSEQVITEKWTLSTVSIDEMNANMINGIKAKELIDVSMDTIEIRSDIRAKSLDVRNMNGIMTCDVKQMANVLYNGLSKANWNFVIVGGYVQWPEFEISPINEIVHFAVTGNEQIITGDIVFTNTTYIEHIASTGIINNVDVRNIFRDCLVKNSKLQIIKGPKIFKQPIHVVHFAVEHDLQAPVINDVNVVQLNNSIFRLAEGNIVSGRKTFVKSPKIERMFSDGIINGIPINDIVFVNSTTILPPIWFHRPIAILKDLTITNNLNRVPFKYIIDNVIRKSGPPQEITGMITFQNLVVQGDTKIPSINNININDIVLKTSDSIQELLEHKTITGDVYIDGPVVITTINGLEVVGAYQSSVFLDKNMVIRRLDMTSDVTLHKGLNVKSQMNGLPIIPLINWKPPTETDLVPLWSSVGRIINEADQLIHLNYGKSFHILYVDYASDIKVKFEANNNHPVSFIIDTVQPGEACGLDHKCDCPAQYDVSLTSFNQIYVNRRPYGERILKMFGFNSNVTVHTNFINACLPNAPIQTIIEWSTRYGTGSLTINEAILSVKLYEIANDIFLLVNHVNGTLAAMKYDHQGNNWFTSDVISGNNVQMDVLEWRSFKVLIVLSRPSHIKNHDVARLWFYNTDVGRQGFEMFEEIPGEYNLCTKLYMGQEDKFVLFLSKTGSQFVSIFMVHWGAQFQLFQTVALSSGIKTFVAFTVDGRLLLSSEEKSLRAEILWAVKCVRSNYSFSSNNGNNALFKDMFPDSAIAESYQMAETKCKYMIQFGLYVYLLEELIADFKGKPFSFKFDETTTSQIKKQYDAYVQYDSKQLNKMASRYVGSLFHGHCTAPQLFDDFLIIGKKLNWDVQFLLQISMDGPYVNDSFLTSLKKELQEKCCKSIIDFGPCVLHTAHNGYKKGLKKLNFDYDGFAYDLWYFFKNSSARREDFKLCELVTQVDSHFMTRHVSSRWLLLKKVSLRIIEQWENLKEYFLVFLPKEKHFKKDIETTARYQKIRKYLMSKTSMIYLGFAVHVGDLFDGFMKLLQSTKPLVHVLYSALGDLFFQIMGNFVKPKVLTDETNKRKDAAQLGVVDLTDKENLISFHDINFGKKAKHQIALLENNKNLDVIKMEMKMCFIEMASYLQRKLPHNNALLADIQYIHPSKRNEPNALSAMGRVAEKFATILSGTKFTDLSIDRYVDLIVQQFQLYQTETFDEHTSYTHWCKVAEMKSINGEFLYEQLAKLSKTILSISHANSDPERGFSENKNILKDRGSLEEETICAIRLVKDKINHGSEENFPVNRRLLEFCSRARQKYNIFLEQKMVEKELASKNRIAEQEQERLQSINKKKSNSEKIFDIDKSIQLEDSKLGSAKGLIDEGNKKLSELINSRGTVNKKELIRAQMFVQTGIEKVESITARVKDLEKQKNQILVTKKK